MPKPTSMFRRAPSKRIVSRHDIRGVAGKALRERIDGATGVEKSVVETLNGAQCDKDLAVSEQQAQRLALPCVAKIGRFGNSDLRGIGTARAIVDRSVALHDERDAQPQQLSTRRQVIVQQGAIGLQQARALREIGRCQGRVAKQRTALGLPIEMARFRRLVDEGFDVLHEDRVQRSLERNRRDDRCHQRGDSRHQRKERDHADVQPGARTPRAPRGNQIARLKPDQHEQDDDDECVAAEYAQHDERRRNERRKAGKDDECRYGEKQSGADSQRPETADRLAFLEAARAFCAFLRGLRRSRVLRFLAGALASFDAQSCNSATMLQDCDKLAAGRRIPSLAETPDQSADGADRPQIEIANFLPQCVAIEAEDLGRLDLIAARRRQSRGDKRRFQFPEQAMIKPYRGHFRAK